MSDRVSHPTDRFGRDRFEVFKIELASDAAHIDFDSDRVNRWSEWELLGGHTPAALTNGFCTSRARHEESEAAEHL